MALWGTRHLRHSRFLQVESRENSSIGLEGTNLCLKTQMLQMKGSAARREPSAKEEGNPN
jgi:hypothetical protein